jgi:hypothetical protein
MVSFAALRRGPLQGLEPPDYPIAYDAGKALAGAARDEGGLAAQWAGQAGRSRGMPGRGAGQNAGGGVAEDQSGLATADTTP